MLERILTPWRLHAYPRAVLFAFGLGFVLVIARSSDLMTESDVPLGGDFMIFYAVGSMTLSGNHLDVFDPVAIQQAQADAIGNPDLAGFHAWVYPPYVALMLAPLALFPYLVSYLLFTGLMVLSTWYAVKWLGQVRPWIAENRFTIFAIIICFYPLLRTVAGGQNTALTLALFCGTLAMLVKDRQTRAGVFVGLLMFKPHLGIPMLGLLLIAGYWRSVVTGLGITGLMFAAAVWFYGWAWPQDWLHSVSQYRVAEGSVNGPNLVSFLGVSEQLFGPGTILAFGVAALPLVALIGYLCLLFWRVSMTIDQEQKKQLLIASWGFATAAVILISPHSQFYELGLLALPAILLAERNRMAAASSLLILWLIAWIHPLFDTPRVQPLFFVLLFGVFLSHRLLHPAERVSFSKA